MRQFSDTSVLSRQAYLQPFFGKKEETLALSALKIQRTDFEEIECSGTGSVSPNVFKKGRAAIGARSSTIPIDWALIHINGEDSLERTNADRVALLARKYARKSLSPEDESRLLIATEQMSNLVPRIDRASFLEIETIAKELERIRQADDEFRKRLDNIKLK